MPAPVPGAAPGPAASTRYAGPAGADLVASGAPVTASAPVVPEAPMVPAAPAGLDAPSAPVAPVAPGHAIERRHLFTAPDIAEFARRCGDPNPLHHDAAAAAASRFGTIIACGPHVTALFMALSAEMMTALGEAVGLGFTFRLRRAVRAADHCLLRWRVTQVARRESLGGWVLQLEGEVLRPDGSLAVGGTGETLLMDPR